MATLQNKENENLSHKKDNTKPGVTERLRTKNKYSQIESYHFNFVHRLKGQREYPFSTEPIHNV